MNPITFYQVSGQGAPDTSVHFVRSKLMHVSFFLLFSLLIVSAAQAYDIRIVHDDPNVSYRVSEFNRLFRELDLNAEMQDRYAITEIEYDLLQAAWQGLSEENQAYILSPVSGWHDFASMFLVDLYLKTTWKTHVKKAATYGALDISLTESRYNSVLYLKRAHETLVDWIYDSPHMSQNGQLIVSQYIDSEVERRIGRQGLKRLHRWESLINEHRDASEDKKLEAVNRFFKARIRQARDEEKEGSINDYWQSPIETLIRGRGDCDDFAIAQYVSLRLLGIPANQLHIAIVSTPVTGNHGVVFFYAEGESDPWVIDNLYSEHLGKDAGLIQRLSVRMHLDHLQPLWVMNESGITEFQEENMDAIVAKALPPGHLPAFATALNRSSSLLQTNDGLVSKTETNTAN